MEENPFTKTTQRMKKNTLAPRDSSRFSNSANNQGTKAYVSAARRGITANVRGGVRGRGCGRGMSTRIYVPKTEKQLQIQQQLLAQSDRGFSIQSDPDISFRFRRPDLPCQDGAMARLDWSTAPEPVEMWDDSVIIAQKGATSGIEDAQNQYHDRSYVLVTSQTINKQSDLDWSKEELQSQGSQAEDQVEDQSQP